MKVIDRFRRCLSGTALDDWGLIRVTHSNNTEVAFRMSVFQMVDDLLDDDVVKNTKKYLKRTRKPRKMNVKSWEKNELN